MRSRGLSCTFVLFESAQSFKGSGVSCPIFHPSSLRDVRSLLIYSTLDSFNQILLTGSKGNVGAPVGRACMLTLGLYCFARKLCVSSRTVSSTHGCW